MNPTICDCHKYPDKFMVDFEEKDTVTKDNKNNKVERVDHPGSINTTASADTVIHHCIPVLSCQDLNNKTKQDNRKIQKKIWTAWL